MANEEVSKKDLSEYIMKRDFREGTKNKKGEPKKLYKKDEKVKLSESKAKIFKSLKLI